MAVKHGRRGGAAAPLRLSRRTGREAPHEAAFVLPSARGRAVAPESVFGGCVWAGGLPVCDILQCYLDVRLSHARGMEQAEAIMDRILRPHFERRK